MTRELITSNELGVEMGVDGKQNLRELQGSDVQGKS
jgi:hypothetical protein